MTNNTTIPLTCLVCEKPIKPGEDVEHIKDFRCSPPIRGVVHGECSSQREIDQLTKGNDNE